MEFKQNLIKIKFPYINTFNHEGPSVIRAMRYITVGVFQHLDITYNFYIDKGIEYTQSILRGMEHKK